MPSVSKAQANLMRAAEHGADFPMAQKVRASMTKEQMHDFAASPTAGKPGHVAHHSPPKLYPTQILKGSRPDIISTNAKAMQNSGLSEFGAVQKAIQAAQHPHKNLGLWLHQKKGA